MRTNYTKRDLNEFNTFRIMFQRFVCRWGYGSYVRLMYNFKIEGQENIPKLKHYIVAGNHVSNLDPFIVADAMNTPIAFMAKQELFDKLLSRLLMDGCGAFAVKRDKFAVSTLKTALSIKNTNWKLGIFPQGTRQLASQIDNINKGFATIAKATKADVLPIALIGTDSKAIFPLPFVKKNDLIVKIGKLIPYNDNVEEMMTQWSNAIKSLTGLEYVKS